MHTTSATIARIASANGINVRVSNHAEASAMLNTVRALAITAATNLLAIARTMLEAGDNEAAASAQAEASEYVACVSGIDAMAA